MHSQIRMSRGAALSRATAPRRQMAVKVQARDRLAGKELAGPNVVQLGATHRHSATVARNADPQLTLTAYMNSLGNDFTVLQMPMGASIVRDGPAQYKIYVPKIQLFDVWFQPEAIATVGSKPQAKTLQSNMCVLNGSHHVTDLKLNDVFNLEVNVCFAWEESQQPTIIGDASLQVDVDVPMPFALMPKGALEVAGNTAFLATLNIMLNGFVNSLVQDYGAWSNNAAIRDQRKANAILSKLA